MLLEVAIDKWWPQWRWYTTATTSGAGGGGSSSAQLTIYTMYMEECATSHEVPAMSIQAFTQSLLVLVESTRRRTAVQLPLIVRWLWEPGNAMQYYLPTYFNAEVAPARLNGAGGKRERALVMPRC